MIRPGQTDTQRPQLIHAVSSAGCDLVFCHAQDRRRCLDNRNIQRNQWDSHHRTSGDDFLRFGSKTSRLFDQFPEVRTGADTQVLRFFVAFPVIVITFFMTGLPKCTAS